MVRTKVVLNFKKGRRKMIFKVEHKRWKPSANMDEFISVIEDLLHGLENETIEENQSMIANALNKATKEQNNNQIQD